MMGNMRANRLKRVLVITAWLAGTMLTAYMAYDLFLSGHGYLVYRQEHQTYKELKQEVETLRKKREHLAREVLRLRNDPAALEELAHRELGYVHKDEFMLIMPPDKGRTVGH